MPKTMTLAEVEERLDPELYAAKCHAEGRALAARVHPADRLAALAALVERLQELDSTRKERR